jgi:hypothetical protein
MNLKVFLNNAITQQIIKTTSFYAVSFIILGILENESPAAACVPGLGMMGFFLLIPISVVLFLISLYKGAQVNKAYLYSSLIHLLFWISIFLWL